jgi:hypothetical protein
LILANPANARAISKAAKEDCADLLKQARDKEQALAEDRLRISCKKLSDVGMEINGMVTRKQIKDCKAVGVDLGYLEKGATQ